MNDWTEFAAKGTLWIMGFTMLMVLVTAGMEETNFPPGTHTEHVEAEITPEREDVELTANTAQVMLISGRAAE